MKKEFAKFPRHAKVWMNLPDGTEVPLGRRAGVRFRQTCYLSPGTKEWDDLVEKFGDQATKKMKELGDNLEARLNAKYADLTSGGMTKEAFEAWKKSELKELNEALAKMEAGNKSLTDALRVQGEEINKLNANKGVGSTEKNVSLEDFLGTQVKKMLDLKAAGAGNYEISSEDLLNAGVTSFTKHRRKAASTTTVGVGTVGGTDGSVVEMGTVPVAPYMPGLGGSDLELFDIIYNPNFILTRVDVGTTNQSRLAWINEVEFAGTVDTDVEEGTGKPLIQHKFQVEFSQAKKAAAYMELTEEFEDDLPGLATAVRRLLQADVLRAFDDAIQAAVIAAAHPYEITGLDGLIENVTLFDTLGALLAQIGYYNFIPNTLALNPVTHWRVLMDKDSDGRYLNPPFMDRLNRLLIEANKIAVDFGLAGDLTQYKVDIYKQFTLRVGWINDNLIKNKFCIVGEIRYHSYISTSRKKAIVYDALADVESAIAAGS